MQIGIPVSMIAMSLQAAAALPATPSAGPLLPSGKWSVEYADSMCVLSRAYGEASNQLTLGFRQLPLSPSTELMLMTNHANGGTTFGDAQGAIKVTIEPAGRTITASYSSRRVQNNPDVRVTTMSLSSRDFADVAKASTLAISVPGQPTFSIALKGTEKAAAALKICNDELLRRWGVDPGEIDLVAVQPSGNPASWIRDNDYPSAAKGAKGQLTAVFKIGTDGRVTDCRTVISSGTAILDATACRLITERARYTPAIGKNDEPMAVHRSLAFTWSRPAR